MVDSKYLLTDEQMAQFITHGFVVLNTDFSDDFHKSVLQKMNDVYATEGNVGNNILPRIPEIQQFFDHPTVQGGLTSILGPDYIMHAHRHGHFNVAGSKGMAWHKDNYWGNEKLRNHHPWSAMIFYYPQDVTEDMGPSGLMPGTQNHYQLTGDQSEHKLSVCGKAGTMALIAYDIWHTAMPNFSEKNRFMLKFLFFRLEAPKRPSWNNTRTEWMRPQQMLPIPDHDLIWEHTWNWLSGSSSGTSSESSVDQAAKRQLNAYQQQLSDPNEVIALNAAYALAAMGLEAIPALIDGLDNSSPAAVRSAAHGLAAVGSPAIPSIVKALNSREINNRELYGHLAFILGEIGSEASEAVPGLIELLQEDSRFVRQHIIEALGLIQEPYELTIPALCDRLTNDSVPYIRFMAGLSLARIGKEAGEAVPALKQALNDSNRYVSAIAASALQRIRSDEALDVLLPFLQTARWCPVTTVESRY
ncbi:MAG: phytanoyl-CoA dioxygenase [Paenibacillus sp.]|nr:phytanoyl-CoA dioxygenase [Paenibacillus sp.]